MVSADIISPDLKQEKKHDETNAHQHNTTHVHYNGLRRNNTRRVIIKLLIKNNRLSQQMNGLTQTITTRAFMAHACTKGFRNIHETNVCTNIIGTQI